MAGFAFGRGEVFDPAEDSSGTAHERVGGAGADGFAPPEVVADLVEAGRAAGPEGRGESGKGIDRPEIQRLLRFIARHHVTYVIVHKVDRLARDREVDVAISLAIRKAGAVLVSVTENIDETPSGKLVHGIMSSIAEFYSANLATEVVKGSTKKAEGGGTPGKAPIGYLNVRTIVNDREARVVEIDPDRGPLMAWAFAQYSTGQWTIRTLLAELTAKGLRSIKSSKRPSKPLNISQLHRHLRNLYYKGHVRYRQDETRREVEASRRRTRPGLNGQPPSPERTRPYRVAEPWAGSRSKVPLI